MTLARAVEVLWEYRDRIPSIDEELWAIIYTASQKSVAARQAGRVQEADVLHQVVRDAAGLRRRWNEAIHYWVVLRSYMGLGAAPVPVLPIALAGAAIALAGLLVIVVGRLTEFNAVLDAYERGAIPDELVKRFLPTDWGEVAKFGLLAVGVWGAVKLAEGWR